MNVSLLSGNQRQTNTINTSDNYSNLVRKKVKSSKKDTVEISKCAYELEQTEKLKATSGKDTLGITKGKEDNSYVIHFSDSAMVSRAVSRGYITVNGIELTLSEEMKLVLCQDLVQVKMRKFSPF